MIGPRWLFREDVYQERKKQFVFITYEEEPHFLRTSFSVLQNVQP